MSSPAAPSGAGGSQRTTWAVPRHGSPGTGPASSGSSTVTGSAGCGCARASRPSAALTTWAQVTISLLPTSAPTPTAPPAGPRNRTMNVSELGLRLRPRVQAQRGVDDVGAGDDLPAADQRAHPDRATRRPEEPDDERLRARAAAAPARPGPARR